MKPAVFDYVRVNSLDEAIEALARYEGEAKVLAGGQSLVPLMNFRLSRPGVLVDINDLAEMAGVRDLGHALAIGSMTRHQQLVNNDFIRERLPILPRVASYIGHWAIRNRGTLGGSVAHADPAAELPALLTALQATIVMRSPRGERRLLAERFFLGYYSTRLDWDEIITEIEIPFPASSPGFYEVARRAGDFALVGALAERGTSGGFVTWFGLGGRPERMALPAWTAHEEERRQLLRELAGKLDLPSEEEYKRTIAVSVAGRAMADAEGGN